MPHHSRIDMIVVDVGSEVHDAERAFWAGATGTDLPSVGPFPEFSGNRLYPGGIGFLVQKTGGGEARVHIDIHTDDLDAEVARLEELGAERVEQHDRWWVMRDPAGLVFCVVNDPDARWDGENVRRWP